jgi:hypothetical protein
MAEALNRRPSHGAHVTLAAGGQKDDDDADNNGYIQVFIRPLEQGNYSVLLSWLGVKKTELSSRQLGLFYGVVSVMCSALVYQLLLADLGLLFHRLCGLVVPIFGIGCAFYWLALYYRHSWSTTSVYVLFCSCFAGEFLGRCVGGAERDSYITQPSQVVAVLVAVGVASVFSTLETLSSTFVIVFVSFVRFLACTSLTDLPQITRPFAAYLSGVVGIIAAKYMETVFKPPVNAYVTPDGKIPVIKRRRSSASTSHTLNSHRAARRTSLPAIIHKNQVGGSQREIQPRPLLERERGKF